MDQVDGSRESSHLERDGAQDNSTAEETKLKNSAKLLGGRVACVVGLLLSAASVIAALLGASADISGGALGIVLGGGILPRLQATRQRELRGGRGRHLLGGEPERRRLALVHLATALAKSRPSPSLNGSGL